MNKGKGIAQDMDYAKIYDNLINSRKDLNRNMKNGVYEKHHIIPKCLDGTNDKNNLILLTPREHYVAHRLLYKQYTGKKKALLAYAFFCLCRNNNQQRKITSRQYDLAKKYMSESSNGQNHPSFGKKYSKEFREDISKRMTGQGNHRYGKKSWNSGLTKETSDILKTIGENAKNKWKTQDHPLLGYKHSDEAKQNMSNAMKGLHKSQEHKDKISKTLTGRKLPKEQVLKMSLARKDIPQRIVKCPYCGKDGGVSAMKRWHFDNCKMK